METENKLPIVADLFTTAPLNTKATEFENKLPDITKLATKPALNAKDT